MRDYDGILTATVDGEHYSWWLERGVTLPQFTTDMALRGLAWFGDQPKLAVVEIDNRQAQTLEILRVADNLNLKVLMRESMERYVIVFRGKFETRLSPIDDLARIERLVFKSVLEPGSR